MVKPKLLLSPLETSPAVNSHLQSNRNSAAKSMFSNDRAVFSGQIRQRNELYLRRKFVKLSDQQKEKFRADDGLK